MSLSELRQQLQEAAIYLCERERERETLNLWSNKTWANPNRISLLDLSQTQDDIYLLFEEEKITHEAVAVWQNLWR